MEAVKRAGGDPPVHEGAGYNGVYTALAGYYYALTPASSPAFRKFSAGQAMIVFPFMRYFSGPAPGFDEKTVNSGVFFPGKGF